MCEAAAPGCCVDVEAVKNDIKKKHFPPHYFADLMDGFVAECKLEEC